MAAAVGAEITVVAHDEVFAFGDADLRAIVVPRGFDVRLIKEAVVHVNAALLDLDDLSGEADDALDEVGLGMPRVLEDNDVAAFRAVEDVPRGIVASVHERDVLAQLLHVDFGVDELVDDEELSAVERREHGTPIDLEVLETGAHREEDEESEKPSLDEFAHERTGALAAGCRLCFGIAVRVGHRPGRGEVVRTRGRRVPVRAPFGNAGGLVGPGGGLFIFGENVALWCPAPHQGAGLGVHGQVASFAYEFLRVLTEEELEVVCGLLRGVLEERRRLIRGGGHGLGDWLASMGFERPQDNILLIVRGLPLALGAVSGLVLPGGLDGTGGLLGLRLPCLPTRHGLVFERFRDAIVDSHGSLVGAEGRAVHAHGRDVGTAIDTRAFTLVARGCTEDCVPAIVFLCGLGSHKVDGGHSNGFVRHSLGSIEDIIPEAGGLFALCHHGDGDHPVRSHRVRDEEVLRVEGPRVLLLFDCGSCIDDDRSFGLNGNDKGRLGGLPVVLYVIDFGRFGLPFERRHHLLDGHHRGLGHRGGSRSDDWLGVPGILIQWCGGGVERGGDGRNRWGRRQFRVVIEPWQACIVSGHHCSIMRQASQSCITRFFLRFEQPG